MEFGTMARKPEHLLIFYLYIYFIYYLKYIIY